MKPNAKTHAISILSDIRKDEALSQCKNFSELHVHCDANMLGDVNSVFEAYSHQVAISIIDMAQQIVDRILRERNAQ